jgi:hypothetical protein
MPNDADHHEVASAMIRSHGRAAPDFARRWAHLNRSANESEAALYWDVVAKAAEGILTGHRAPA